MTGGTDGDGGGDGPVVLLLHGFGAPGEDLVPLWRGLDAPRGTRFVFPEAPIALGGQYGDGRAWWHIDLVRMQTSLMTGRPRDLTGEVPEGLAEARASIEAVLAAMSTELGVPRSAIAIGGFSQGAMLAIDVTLRSDAPFAGLIVMSGTLIAEDEWRPLFPGRRGLRAVQSHGKEDPLLPFAIAERLRDEMQAAGIDVTWVPFRGGHAIAPQVMDAIGPFLHAVLPSGGVKAGSGA